MILTFGASESADFWDDAFGPSCSMIFFRDDAGAGYYRGIRGLGRSIDESAESIRRLIAEHEPTEILSCGTGLGGHAALVFGVLLGATRIVAFEPVAHLVADELASYNDRRWDGLPGGLPEPSLARTFEIPTLMARTGFTGRACVLFGTGRGNDCGQAAHLNLIHAQWLARSDRVALAQFPDVRHDLCAALAGRGGLKEVLERYLFGEIALPQESPTSLPADVRPVAARPCTVSLRLDGPEGVEIVYAAAGDGEPPEVRKIDDELRRWIAENLILGEPHESIAKRMKQIGFSEPTALHEIKLAAESPYLRGAALLQNRLRKREWLLSVYRTLGRLRPESGEIERRMTLYRDDFFRDYYIANVPVIFEQATDARSDPPRWSLDDLGRRFGERDVRVRLRLHEINRDNPFQEKPTQVIRFAEYVEMTRRAGASGDFCLTAEDEENRAALSELLEEVGPFAEYLEDREPPAGIIRLAPGGATHAFRHESENILLAVMMGKMRVKLVPSWDLPAMRNSWRESSDLDGRSIPANPASRPGHPQVLECVVEQGELLFVPVGWWHFIEWLEPSADVTFTNFSLPNAFPPCDIGDGKM